jgi:predicted nucleic acid-binding Zn ribbon protein
MTDRKKRPESLGHLVANFLGTSGLAARVDQAAVIPDWPRLVGPQISAVTTPQSISANGTLFVHVTTNAWMNELSLLEPELLRSLNGDSKRPPIRRIRWLLAR